MVNFFATEETVTVQLDDQGHYVEIKRGLDYGEESELEGAMMTAGFEADGSPKVDFTIKKMRQLKLALYIAEWNLTGGSGRIIALPDNLARRQEIVGRLAPHWAKKIMAQIDALRAESGDPEAIKIADEDAGGNPTSPGVASAPGTPSPSPNGSAAPIATLSEHLSVS